MATVIVSDGEIVTTCCQATPEVTRPVSDIVAFTPIWADGQNLGVRYAKVHEGEAGAYTVRCPTCGGEIEIEVIEN